MAKIASKTVLENGVKFDFMNGKTVQIDLAAIPQEIVHKAALHGLSQKIGDSYASAESIEEAVANATDVINNLLAGNWNAGRVSTGGKLAEALATVTGKTIDEAIEALSAMDDKEKAALKKHPQMKVELARMELERASKVVPKDGAVDLTKLFN